MSMIDVTVISAQGATLRGPLSIRISKDQHARRQSVLGAWRRGGVFDIDGGQSVQFKLGEVIGVDGGDQRLSRAVFAWDDPEAVDQDSADDAAGNAVAATGNDAAA